MKAGDRSAVSQNGPSQQQQLSAAQWQHSKAAHRHCCQLDTRAFSADIIASSVAQTRTLIHNVCAAQCCKHALWCLKTYSLLSKHSAFRLLRSGLWREGRIMFAILYVLWEAFSAEEEAPLSPPGAEAGFGPLSVWSDKMAEATAVDVFRCWRKPLGCWSPKMRFLCDRC